MPSRVSLDLRLVMLSDRASVPMGRVYRYLVVVVSDESFKHVVVI